jgi:hypothetical protein
MKALVLLLSLSSAVFGQSLEAKLAFAPFGPWQFCGTNQTIPYLSSMFGSANYCSTLTKGSEPDLLSINSLNPLTTDFLYIATGVDSTGVSKTVTGHFKRNDNSAGYSSCIVDAGMTTALVTVVEYSYEPATGSFVTLQTGSGHYQ